MKKKYIVLLFCISFLITGCVTKDNEISKKKESFQTEGISSQNSHEEVVEESDNSKSVSTENSNTENENKENENTENENTENTSTESTNKENKNYESYSGYWTVGGISHETLISDGGTEFSVTITNKNELSGYLFSQQGISQRIAEVDDITGKVENDKCYYDFVDDGWEGSGTLYIRFLEDEIIIEVQNYKMSDNNSSGFGINGTYKLTRADKALEKIEPKTEMSEEELQSAVYDRYYSQWSDESMIEAIEEKKQYLNNCSFYNEVVEYMENVREVRDISLVIEPLFYTDMEYYKSQDFENEPLLILHLAKNEIYARHGYIFKNEDLNNYYMGQLWYEPSLKPEDFDNGIFNEYEKANLRVLAELDKY